MIEMIPLICDNILLVGYDENNNSLQIKYDDNSLFEYYNVELTIFTDLLFSKSKSTFIQENIYDKCGFAKVS